MLSDDGYRTQHCSHLMRARLKNRPMVSEYSSLHKPRLALSVTVMTPTTLATDLQAKSLEDGRLEANAVARQRARF
jgi:hypothetical protein